MRAMPLVLLAACASPSPTPAEPPPPPVVSVGDSPPVVMTAATAPPPAPAPKAPQVRPNGDGPIPVYTDDPTRGDDLAPVTVVVFTDYQCPPCKLAVHAAAFAQGELGDASVRLVHKHFPLQSHPQARPAAEAAVAVHQLGGVEAFEIFQQRMLDDQSAIDETRLPEWAAEAGVSQAKLRAFLDGPTAAAKVDRDVALARELDVVGVPDVRINCEPLDAAIDPVAIRNAAAAELKAAEEALAKGASRDAIYRTRCDARTDDG